MRLDDVRVLDLSRLLPGPYATQLLADLGATVLKIEEPADGDYARGMGTVGESGYGRIFEAVNRGKRSVALDLKDEAGREAFYELVEGADVVFETFRPGVAERLEIGRETLSRYNEELIYVSLSGYGRESPNAKRAGHDLNYAGASGLLDMTRPDADSKPTIPGYPVVDMASGLFSAFSIVSALLARELGSGGTRVDIAMTDVMLSFSQLFAGGALAGDAPRPGETMLTGKYPCYDVYRTADGRYLTLAALEPKFWNALCAAMDRPELAENHLSDDPAVRTAVRETLRDAFESKPLEAWLDEFEDVDTAVGGVFTLPEALDDPQTAARDMVVTESGAPPRLGFPARTPAAESVPTTVPDRGEHTEDALREAGLAPDEIERVLGRDRTE
ncbi:CaiB/BaiF CoA transferase family protein [Haladaptatus salinisoli]|uniref:CaiB/BaiF CoA transferase family protein n=1 Tax=Haladaptatus salinisoli TaxID=2884876 RepID=UPI001D0A9718|nr:CaiB/BaiF CoA-transferase family protein [Haladaptatus salinisoli]